MSASGGAGGAGGLGGAQSVDVAQVQQAAAKADAQEIIATQEQSDISLVKDSQDLTNPAASTRVKKKEDKFETLESRRKGSTEKTEKKAEGTEEKPDSDLADKYNEANAEISPQDLRSIRSALTSDSSSEEILDLLDSKFPDPVLKHTALDYLLQTTPNTEGKLKEALTRAQQNHLQNNRQAITGGSNILLASQEYSDELNVPAAGLRQLYLNVTSDFHSCEDLLNLLQDKYSLTEMNTVSSFLLKGMTMDLKSEGPSVSPVKLQVMMTEIRNLQAVTSTYSFFEAKFPSLTSALNAEGLSLPSEVTPRKLADTFFSIVNDKFPTASKAERSIRNLVGEDVETVSGVLNLFFTAIRGTSPRLYDSAEKRQQLCALLANALDMVNVNNEDYPKSTDFPKPYPWS